MKRVKQVWSAAWVVVLVACGSSGGAGGGGGGDGPPVGGKQLPDEQVCREDSPCPNVVGTDEEYQACMDKMQPAAQDPCRQAMVEQRVCVVSNTKCNEAGDPDEAASIAAWEAACKPATDAFMACCSANPTSIFCGPLDH